MSTFIPALLILLYCGWNARQLIITWGDPQEKGAFFAFLIWMLPFIDYWLIQRKVIQPNQKLLIASVMISLTGFLGSVNAIMYIGFATAVASFLPVTLTGLPWLICMITWTTAFGWIGLYYFPQQAPYIRTGIALFGSLWMIYFLRIKRDQI